MLGVSDTQPVADTHRASGPCVLGSIRDETAQIRAASVAHALAATRNVDLLVSETVTSLEETTALPESHRAGYCSTPDTLEGEATLDPVVDQHEPSALVCKRRTEQHLIDELFSDRAERLSRKTDVVTVDNRGETDRIASILVPIAGGDHSQLAVETAVALAAANDAAVDLFHVIEADTDEAKQTGQQLLAEASATVDPAESDRVDTWLYETPGAAAAITEQSNYYDLTVMGAPTDSPLKRFVFGSTSKQVQREADSPVIVVHTHNSA